MAAIPESFGDQPQRMQAYADNELGGVTQRAESACACSQPYPAQRSEDQKGRDGVYDIV